MSNLTLSFKDKILSVHPLDDDGITEIGSQVESGINIDSLAVSPRHAWVVTKEEQSVLEDLGSEAGTFVNGQKVDQPYTLKDGDKIAVGKHQLVFKFEARQHDEAIQVDFKEKKTVAAWIQFLSGDNLGKTIPLTKSMTSLGKQGKASVISRRGDGYYISHLEGDQTPSVNGENIGDESYALTSGDKITIGKINILFYTDEEELG